MIAVSNDVHFAACRFALLKGGKFHRSQTEGAGGIAAGNLLEYRLPSGEVLARKVAALGDVHCWLREDVAQAARAALDAEAAAHERVRCELAEFIRSTDRQGASRNGVTVEQYRAQRHAAGARWDNYRAKQRAGGGI